MKKFINALLTAVALGVLPQTCSKNSSELPSAPPQASAPQAAAPATTSGVGAIVGSITYAGPSPKENPNPAKSFPECGRGDPGDRHASLRAKNGKLAGVFVYIKEGISGTYPAPNTPVVLDQDQCAYRPRVFGIQVGQPLDILNSDSTLHNVHSLSKNSAAFNVGMPMKGMKITRTFNKPEVMVAVKCDVHSWMHAYAGVLTHPFYAVSDADGRFEIQNAPAGNYTIEAWHEKLGTQTQTISLSAQDRKEIAFAFSAKP